MLHVVEYPNQQINLQEKNSLLMPMNKFTQIRTYLIKQGTHKDILSQNT